MPEMAIFCNYQAINQKIFTGPKKACKFIFKNPDIFTKAQFRQAPKAPAGAAKKALVIFH